MKNYLVFKIEAYYPGGGMNDLIGDFDTLEEAIKFADENKCGKYDYFYIDIYSLSEKKSLACLGDK